MEQLSELGADTDDVPKTYRRDEYDKEVKGIIALVKEYAAKYGRHIPVITAGGIYDHQDVMHQMELGVDGVQVATRFVTTEECDADPAFKQTYLDARPQDIEIIKSPVGMPGRAIHSSFLDRVKEGLKRPKNCPFDCIKTCDVTHSPYCIMLALYNAFKGQAAERLRLLRRQRMARRRRFSRCAT